MASLLARLYDFVAGTKIKSEEVDAEFNQLVDGHNDLLNDMSVLPSSTTVLLRSNTDSYTPLSDYNPATKKYVDDIAQNFALGVLAEKSVTLPMLSTEVQDMLTTAPEAGSSAGVELFATDFVGTTLADALAWGGQAFPCGYASAGSIYSDSGTVVTTDLKFGAFTAIVRMRASTKTPVTDSISVVVKKLTDEETDTWDTLTTKLFSLSDFADATNYDVFYVPFTYGGSRAILDEISITVQVSSAASDYVVYIDSVTILPSVIGIVG